ncbi:gluconate 2-dehydrogenase subunit 3 family protein [Thiohalobacter sp. IOR34]|uniref:gluconate 2-dehydrogenase subunit 3 family protein n=1 Tax=Thiohalobacter sp. IOR34 TaxID=3057176 RepID=UPI0025B24215|nr:gluconate 2-dehydrogenase subunit 3 family protein [Thiohalobacter sp. IOR34]WJW75980.1 gluconate 2-dehydrogenase subunit 3 family protein [Thiohalobacter sp. IOR34]
MNKPCLSRRQFISRLGLLGGLAAACPPAALAALRANAEPMPAEEPWRTLAAVQAQLFPPGPGIPGAREIGALRYLRQALENPAAAGADLAFVRDGAGWLNDLARKTRQRDFAQLDAAGRETLLRRIERSRAGSRWLSLLLDYLLEALLADPVYGGNPDGSGWRWLEHQPGYPTPMPDKRWFQLAARRFSRHKG